MEEDRVKRCPYCAEDIGDGVVRCPHCGSDVTVDPDVAMGPRAFGPPPTGPPPPSDQPPAGPSPVDSTPVDPSPVGTPEILPALVGEGAARFSHSGQRYILGFGPDFFGIWDRTTPGGAIARFPRTDVGWNEAWNRFIGMESRFIEVPHAGPSPDHQAPAREGFRPLGALGGWTVGLLAATIAMTLVTLILRIVEVGRLHQYQRDPSLVREAIDASDAVTRAAAFVIPLAIAAGVLWLIWQHRAQANLAPLGAEGLRFTPGWAVGWWFIPFAWFVKPFQTMTELWKASDPSPGAIEWMNERATPLLMLWWGAFLIRIPLAGIATTQLGDTTATVDRLISGQLVAIALEVTTIVAAILAIVLVRQIGRRQEGRRARVAAYRTAASAGAPV
jgi:uncharacterized protein DUF4328